jgi:hypothetical protein
MKQFMEERARVIRSLADKADPFTRTRLLTLAEKYELRVRDGVDGNSQGRAAPGRIVPIKFAHDGLGTDAGGACHLDDLGLVLGVQSWNTGSGAQSPFSTGAVSWQPIHVTAMVA